MAADNNPTDVARVRPFDVGHVSSSARAPRICASGPFDVGHVGRLASVGNCGDAMSGKTAVKSHRVVFFDQAARGSSSGSIRFYPLTAIAETCRTVWIMRLGAAVNPWKTHREESSRLPEAGVWPGVVWGLAWKVARVDQERCGEQEVRGIGEERRGGGDSGAGRGDDGR